MIGQTGNRPGGSATGSYKNLPAGLGPVGQVGVPPTGVIGPDSGCPPTGLLLALCVLAVALGVALAVGGC